MKRRARKRTPARAGPNLLPMTPQDLHAILAALVAKARSGDPAAAAVLLAGETWRTVGEYAEYLEMREAA